MTASTASSSPPQLFLPDSSLGPAPRSTPTTAAHAPAPRAFGWGTRTVSALVVFGVVRAESVQAAAQLVAERGGGRTAHECPVEALVEFEAGEDGQGPAGVVLLGPSSTQAPLVILYTPLKQLELLSLKPLRLGFQPQLEEVKGAPGASRRRTRSSSGQGKGLVGVVATVRPLFSVCGRRTSWPPQLTMLDPAADQRLAPRPSRTSPSSA